jgi:hypothetical protein
LPHGRQFDCAVGAGIDLDQKTRWRRAIKGPAAAASRIDLDQLARGSIARQNDMTPRRHPPIRDCPLCGVAMQASKSREDLAEFDTFRCQSCGTTISENRPPPAHAKVD